MGSNDKRFGIEVETDQGLTHIARIRATRSCDGTGTAALSHTWADVHAGDDPITEYDRKGLRRLWQLALDFPLPASADPGYADALDAFGEAAAALLKLTWGGTVAAAVIDVLNHGGTENVESVVVIHAQFTQEAIIHGLTAA